MLRGEPGVGKTALLDYAIGSAPDLRVLRAVGVESEMELAFASLQQLCAPMLDRLGRLPGPPARCAERGVWAERGQAPDQFLVGLAAKSAIGGRRGAASALCGGRCSVVGRGVGLSACVRGAPAPGGVGGDRVGYNAIALPIAAGIFEPAFGLVLRPEIAAISMSGSSFLVAANAVLLKRLRLPATVEALPSGPPPPSQEEEVETRAA